MQTKRISFVTQEGYKYVLKFTNEPNELNYDIVSISVDLHNEKISSLNLKDILSISRIFRDFLDGNQHKILTYVCDARPVFRSIQNQKLNP